MTKAERIQKQIEEKGKFYVHLYGGYYGIEMTFDVSDVFAFDEKMINFYNENGTDVNFFLSTCMYDEIEDEILGPGYAIRFK